MEITENVQTPLVNTPIPQEKKSNPGKGILLVLGSILLIASGALGYKIYEDKFVPAEDTTVDTEVEEEKTKDSETFTVTSSTAYDSTSEYFPYLIFEIKYGSKYLVTSDDMLTDYKSQGGSMNPVLMLSTVTQPLGTTTYDDLLSQNEGSSIAVWSTIGFDDIDEWFEFRDIANPVTVSEENVETDMYVFEKRTISSTSRSQNIVVAYLNIYDDLSYFFETNNVGAENDLDSILNSFDVRGEVE